MKVKYNNKWYDVLDTREFFGSTFYAIEDECRVKWLKDTDVEKNKNKVMAADKIKDILKHFPDLEEGWKEMEEKLKTEPVEGEMLSLKYREMLQRESSKESLVESEFTKAKRAESDFKGNRNNRRLAMAHLIDKNRIVAEIEKLIADETESIKSFEHGKNVSEVQRSNARIGILIHIRSLLDTLEVEEVDIEKEVIDWWNAHYSSKAYTFEGYSGHYLENSTVINIAKHFFELGLKAQKGE